MQPDPKHSYYVVMFRPGIGLPSIADPKLSRTEIVRAVASQHLPIEHIAFIHYIHHGRVDDVGTEIFVEAAAYLKGRNEIQVMLGNNHERNST